MIWKINIVFLLFLGILVSACSESDNKGNNLANTAKIVNTNQNSSPVNVYENYSGTHKINEGNNFFNNDKNVKNSQSYRLKKKSENIPNPTDDNESPSSVPTPLPAKSSKRYRAVKLENELSKDFDNKIIMRSKYRFRSYRYNRRYRRIR